MKSEIREMVDMMQKCAGDLATSDGYYSQIDYVEVPSIVIAGLEGDPAQGEPELTVIPIAEALVKFRKAKSLVVRKRMGWWEAIEEVGLL